MEERLHAGISRLHAPIRQRAAESAETNFAEQFVGITVLFRANGTGIFGALHEGMTGDASVLIVKAGLNLFTAGDFCNYLGLRGRAALDSAVQMVLLFSAHWIRCLPVPA